MARLVFEGKGRRRDILPIMQRRALFLSARASALQLRAHMHVAPLMTSNLHSRAFSGQRDTGVNDLINFMSSMGSISMQVGLDP